MAQAVASGYLDHDPTVEPPPPYTENEEDSIANSPAASLDSLSSTGSTSPTLSPLSDSKTSQPVQLSEPLTQPDDSDKQLAQSSQAAEALLPADIQKARSPLQVRQKNSSIATNILLFKGESSSATMPDVSFHTKNSKINSTVYVNAEEWGRPVTIEAVTKNSNIVLAVQPLQPGQAVDIKAETKNSSNTVLLPQDFKGLLVIGTSNHSKTNISPNIQKASVRVSNSNKEVMKMFKPPHGNISNVAWYEINGADGPSRAIVMTKNSQVSAAFIGDEGFESAGSCIAS